jgi:hypothetical protein
MFLIARTASAVACAGSGRAGRRRHVAVRSSNCAGAATFAYLSVPGIRRTCTHAYAMLRGNVYVKENVWDPVRLGVGLVRMIRQNWECACLMAFFF